MRLMREKRLYEYAVIRVVPRVERGEYINVGVILYCRDAGFLDMKFEVQEEKIYSLFAGANIEKIVSALSAFRKICCGAEQSGTIGLMPPAERFRWLTARRSTIIQVSGVHPGFCDDPAIELEKLFEAFVIG